MDPATGVEETKSGTLIVKDVDDEPPEFTNSIYHVEVPEDKSVGETIFRLTAEDADCDITLRYEIESSVPRMNSSDYDFEIIELSGVINVREALDRELHSNYQLTIVVRDSVNANDTTVVNITILDINDNKPTFTPAQRTYSLTERAPIGLYVGRVSASDPDLAENGTFSYMMGTGNTGDAFAVNSSTGIITVIGDIDRERTPTFNLEIYAVDNSVAPMTGTAEITVNILDINDNIPMFGKLSYAGYIYENEAAGSQVLEDGTNQTLYVAANDSDAGSNARVSYRILQDDVPFQINSSSGVITTTQRLNYESESEYSLTVYAVDGGGFSSSPVEVTISVLNRIDTTPTFEEDLYTFTVSEGRSNGTFVGVVKATGAFPIEYRLDPNDDQPFEIDSTSGNITTTERFDREDEADYTITVQASMDGFVTFSNVSVMVSVSDRNDEVPMFLQSSYSFNITETSSTNIIIGSVSATDRDGTLSIQYTISAGDDENVFDLAWDGSTGIIFNRLPVDHEVSSLYNLTITASDGTLSSNVSVYIDVLDINDNPPRFNQSEYNQTVPEYSRRDYLVTTMVAEDPDAGLNGTVTYTMTPVDPVNDTYFTINNNTGEVTVLMLPSKEEIDRYEFTVEAMDRSSPYFTDSAQLVIYVVDVNEPPVVASAYNLTLSENTTSGNFFQLNASHGNDDPGNSGVQYRLQFPISESGNGTDNETMTDEVNLADYITINDTTGVISIIRPFDYEAGDRYFDFTIISEDPSNPSINSTTSILLIITDTNDNPVYFKNNSYFVEQNESIAEGDIIFNFGDEVLDVDEISHTMFRFTILNTSASSNFLGVDPNTGEVFVERRLDFETHPEVSITVQVSDGIYTDTAELDVTVYNANDGPEFTQRVYYVSVSEDSPNDTYLITVSAMDHDNSTGFMGWIDVNITYGLIDDDILPFTIDPDTGEVNLTGSLDRELVAVYNLTLFALGNTGVQSTAILEVTVLDINDNMPIFQFDSPNATIYTATVYEGAPIRHVVTSVLAEDADAGENQTVIYSLQPFSNNSLQPFSINSATGEITLSQLVDREENPVINVTIVARDNGTSPMSSSATLVVSVSDENDNTPEFVTDLIFGISEGLANNSVGFQIEAVDPDAGENGTVYYDWMYTYPSECEDFFSLDPNTGNFTITSSLNINVTKVSRCFLGVFAKDRGQPQRETEAGFYITILPAAHDAPAFVSDVGFVGRVAEATEIGVYVLTVTAIPDEGLIVEYALQTDDPMLPFALDSESGAITVCGVYDRETTPYYNFNVTATDNGFPSLTSTTSVRVDIIDVNDEEPVFSNDSYVYMVRESASLVYPIFTLSVMDRDIHPNNILSFRFLPNEENQTNYGTFRITSAGEVYLLKPLDFDSGRFRYVLNISVTDGKFTNFAEVVVELLDSNDAAPMFSNLPNRISIREDTETGDVVFNVDATDLDSLRNAFLEYQLDDPYNMFDINSTTGVVSVTGGGFDYELGMRQFVLSVTVIDRLPRNLTAEDLNGTDIADFLRHYDPDEGRLNATSELVIDIIDVNDNRPMFLAPFEFEVVENDQVSITVGRVDTIDLDSGENSRTEYNITAGDEGRFTIDSVTGIIRSVPPLNREVNSSYSLLIVATDFGSPRMSSNRTFLVIVTDAPDTPPRFAVPDGGFLFAKVEENRLSAFVMNVTATDPDDGDLTYYLLDQSENFVINNRTGEVRTSPTKIIDREQTPFVTIGVEAVDSSGLTDTVIVVVEITDVNDSPPVFERSDYFVNITENTPLDSLVLTLTASDPDLGRNAVVNYEKVNGSDFFEIDRITGEIKVVKRLCINHIDNAFHTILVRAYDAENRTLYDLTEVSIVVHDVNVYTPMFLQPSYVVRINRETRAGTVVFSHLSVFDNDYCTESLTLSILSGNEDNTFSFDTTSGELVLTRDISPDDFDFVLRIRVTDAGHSAAVPTKWSEINVYILVGAILPISISLSEGFAVPPLVRVSSSLYQQEVWIPTGGQFAESVDVNFTLGGEVFAQQSVQVEQSPADYLKGAVASEVIHYSKPEVKIVVQVFSAGHEVHYVNQTAVFAELSPYGELANVTTETVRETCLTQPPLSTCELTLTVPDKWFEYTELGERIVQARYGFDGVDNDKSQLIPSIYLEPRPVVDREDYFVQVSLPAHPIYPDDEFDIQFSTNWPHPVALVAVHCTYDESIEFEEVQFNSLSQVVYESHTSGQFSVTYTDRLYYATPPNFNNPFLTVTMELSDDVELTNGTAELDFECVVDYVADATGGTVQSGGQAFHVGRSVFNNGTPVVYAAENFVNELILYSDEGTLVNTAVLTGNKVSTSIKGIAVYANGKIEYEYDDLSCTSSDVDVVKVTTNCEEAYLNGTESEGSNMATIRASPERGEKTYSVYLQVWYPRQIDIRFADETLNTITGCVPPKFQETAISIEGTFVSGTLRSGADLTSLLKDRLRSIDVDVASLDLSRTVPYAVGKGAGTTIITIDINGQTFSSSSLVVTEVEAAISDFTVTVVSVKESRFFSSSVAGLSHTALADINISDNFTRLYQRGIVYADAVMSDGSVLAVNKTRELLLSSLDMSTVDIDDGEIVVYRPRSGRFLHSEWTTFVCATSTRFVKNWNINAGGISPPVSLRFVTDSGYRLALDTFTSQVLNLSSSLTFEIELTDTRNRTFLISNDPRTFVNASTNLDLNGLTASIGSNVLAGPANITAYFDYDGVVLSTTLNLELVGIVNFTASVELYPEYSDSSDTILYALAYTSPPIYQSASIVAQVTTTSGDLLDVSSRDEIRLNVVQNTNLTVRRDEDGVRVIEPLSSTEETITVWFGNFSDSVNVTSSDEELLITRLFELELDLTNDTLAGVVGTEASITGISAELSSGGILLDFRPYLPYYMDLLTFNTSNSNVSWANLSSMSVQLVSNAPGLETAFLTLQYPPQINYVNVTRNVTVVRKINSTDADGFNMTGNFTGVNSTNRTEDGKDMYITEVVQVTEVEVVVDEMQPVTGTVEYYANVAAELRGVDLGEEYGPPAVVSSNSLITIPITMNFAEGDSTVDAVVVSILYNTTGVRLVGILASTEMNGGHFYYSFWPAQGVVKLGGINTGLQFMDVAKDRYHLGTVVFQVLERGSLYGFSAIVEVLAEASLPPEDAGDSILERTAAGEITVEDRVFMGGYYPPPPLPTTLQPPVCNYSVPGDSTEDCVFTLKDALYGRLLATEAAINPMVWTDNFENSIDYDHNGVVDMRDIWGLERAGFELVPLISDVSIIPVTADTSNCRLTLTVSLYQQSLLDTNVSLVYFGVFSNEYEFQRSFDNTTLSTGSLVSDNRGIPNNSYGGWWEAENVGNSVFQVQTEPGFLQGNNVGVVAVVIANNVGTDVVQRHVSFLNGPLAGKPEFGSMSTRFTVRGRDVYVNSTSGFDPLEEFDIPYTAFECFNEHAPMFTIRGPYNQILRETASPRADILLPVSATDDDDGPTGELKYVIYNTTQPGLLQIFDNGSILLNYPLDYELYSSVNLTIQAIDQGPHVYTRKTATIGYLITVVDDNDNPPVPEYPSYEVVIEEGVTGLANLTIRASDGDKFNADYRAMQFYIIDGDRPNNPHFSLVSIDNTSVQLNILRPLDRESQSEFNLTLIVNNTYPTDPPGPTATQFPVRVLVADANDNPPVFPKGPITIFISESTPPNSIIYILQATDKDSGNNARITYFVDYAFPANALGTALNGTRLEGEYLHVDHMSGNVTLLRSLDREGDIKALSCQFHAEQDGIVNPVTIVIHIIVCNENDEIPEFIGEPYTSTLAETVGPGAVVATVRAQDRDLGSFCASDAENERLDSEVSYVMTSADGGPFQINSESGVVTTSNGSLDRESRESYNLIVTARDRGVPPQEANTTITVIITDINDMAPTFDKEVYEFSVDEGVMTALTPSLIITDRDGVVSGGEVASVTISPSGLPFSISSVTGDVYNLAVTGSTDRETTAEYNFTLIATDNGVPPLSSLAIVIVNINDINDNPPQFLGEPYYGSITEGSPVGTVVFQLRGYDLDGNSTMRFSKVNSSMSPPYDGALGVDEVSGEVYINEPLCYDASLSGLSSVNFTLGIAITDDNGGGNTISSFVTFSLEDSNLKRPEFIRDSYIVVVPRNTQSGDTILIVNATDELCSHPLKYKLEEGADSALFSVFTVNDIDREPPSGYTLGEVRTNGLLTSKDVYSFTVVVEDGGSVTTRSSTATVTVYVGSVPAIQMSSTFGFAEEDVVSSSSARSFSRRYYFGYSSDEYVHSFTASFGGISRSSNFTIEPQPVTDLLTTIPVDEIFADEDYVYIIVQALNSWRGTLIQETNVTASASLNGDTSISENVVVSFISPIATVRIPIPLSWREISQNETRMETIVVTVSSGSVTKTHNVSLTTSPAADAVFDDDANSNYSVLVSLPKRNLYPSGQSHLFIYTKNENNPLTSLVVECDLEDSYQFDIATGNEGWAAAVEESGGKLRIQANWQSSAGSYVPAELTVPFTVPETTSKPSASMSCRGILTVRSQPYVFSNEEFEVLVSSREELTVRMGTVYYARRELSDVLISTSARRLVNTAVFTGVRVEDVVSYTGLWVDTVPYFEELDDSVSISCTSGLEVNIERDCSTVYLNGMEEAGNSDAMVNVSFSYGEDTLLKTFLFEIWYPDLPLIVSAADQILNPIMNYRVDKGTCVQGYQWTTLSIQATFRTSPTSNAFNASVESLINEANIQSSADNIASVDGLVVRGESPGISTISIRDSVDGSNLGSVNISVVTTPVVNVLGTLTYSASDIGLSPDNVPVPPSGTLTANLITDLNRIDQNLDFVTFAFFSDNTWSRLSAESGLLYNASETELSVDRSQATVVGAFAGYPVTAVWSSECDGTLSEEPVSLRTNIDSAAARLYLVVPHSRLVPSLDVSLSYSVGLPNSTTVRVFLVTDNGENEVEVTTNPNVLVTIDVDEGVTLTKLSNGSYLLQVTSSANVSNVAITASMDVLNVVESQTIQIVRSDEISVSVRPYPSYQSSPSLSTLSLVGNTNLYQYAQLDVQWVFDTAEGEYSIPVNNNDYLTLSTTDEEVVEVGEDSRITVNGPGDVYVRASIGPLNAFTHLSIVNDSIYVMNVFEFDITTNSLLSGTFGSTAAKVRLGFSFSDGTQLLDFYGDDGALYPGLVDIESDEESAVRVNNVTGEVSIYGNLAGMTQISVEFNDEGSAERSSESFAVNLQPRLGEVDLGGSVGVPIPSVNLNNTVRVPVVLNVRSWSIGAWEIAVAYSHAHLELTSVSVGSDWGGNIFQHSGTTFQGAVLIGGIAENTKYADNGTLEVAVLNFKAISSTTTTPAALTAEILVLVDKLKKPLSLVTPSSSSIVGVNIDSTATIVVEAIPSSYLDVFRPSRNPCDLSVPCSCGDNREPGDTNGDCVLNVLDAAENCDSFWIDVDRDGVCDRFDYYIILKAAFYDLPILSDYTISTIDSSNCYFKVSVQFVMRGRREIDSSLFDVAVLLSHTNQSFLTQFDSSTIRNTLGEVATLTRTTTSSVNLRAIKAAYVEDGLYQVEMNSNLLLPDVGVSMYLFPMGENAVHFVRNNAVPPDYPEPVTFSLLGGDFAYPLGFTPLDSTTFTLTSNNCINDAVPVFYPSSFELNVTENSENLQVGRVYANDSDPGSGGVVRYHFESPVAMTLFNINQSTGVITLHRPLDREGPSGPLIEFGVVAIDNGVRPKTGTITVRINVLDVNDNPPVFRYSSYEVSAYEGRPRDSVVLDLSVTDPDAGEGATISYQILGSPQITDYFSVDDNGVLRTRRSLDYETIRQFSFIVVASDGGTPSLSSSAEVTVTVLPVNEYPPTCPVEEFSAAIHRNGPIGDEIITIAINDGDQYDDHRDMNFIIEAPLSISSEFDLRKVAPNTFTLATATSTFSLLTYRFSIRAESTDNEDSCRVTLNIEFADEMPFDLVVSGPGYLTMDQTLLASTATSSTARQNILFIGDLGESVEVNATVRGRSLSSETISKPLQPPSEVVGYIQERVYWSSSRTVSAVLQLRDSSHSTVAVDGSGVTLELVPLDSTNSEVAGESVSGGTCEPHYYRGVCWMSVVIPGEWFESDGYSKAAVYAVLSGQKSSIGEISISANPSISLDISADNLLVSLPYSAMLKNEEFEVTVSALSSEQVTSFQLELSAGVGEIAFGIPKDFGNWMCQTNLSSSSSVLKLACLLQSNHQSTDIMNTPQSIFSLKATVLSTTATVSVQGAVSLLATARGTLVTGRSVSSRFLDRDGIDGDQGTVYIRESVLVGILAYTNSSELVNTAVFRHVTSVTASIEVYGVYSTRVQSERMVLLSESLTCTSDGTVRTLGGCSGVELTRSNTLSSERTEVTIRYGTAATFKLPLRVWQPVTDRLRVNIRDKVLQPISGLYEGPACDRQLYQHTRLYVTGIFRAGVLETPTLDLTVLLLPILEFSVDGVVNLESVYVSAATTDSLSTSVAVDLFESAQDIVRVSDGSTEVQVNIVEARVYTEFTITATPPTNIPVTSGATVTINVVQNFLTTEQEGRIFATLYTSDGYGWMTVADDDDLISLDSDVTITSSVLKVNAPVTSQGVNFSLSPSQTCSSSLSTSAFVTTNLPTVQRVVMTTSFNKVAHRDSGIPEHLVPSSTTVQVSVVLNDGTMRDIDPTGIDFSSAHGLLNIVAGTNSFQPSSSTASGEDVLSVLFDYNGETFYVERRISVVVPVDMEVRLQPYPTYEGSREHSLTVMRAIEGIFYQRIIVVFRVQLSDATTVDVFPTSNSQVDVDPPNMLFETDFTTSGTIIKPVRPMQMRNAIISGSVGPVNASVVLTVHPSSTQHAKVRSITLNPTVLTESAETQIAIYGSLLLDDGTRYVQMETSSTNASGLSGVLNFTISPSDVGTIDGNVIMITNNHPTPVILTATVVTNPELTVTTEIAANLRTDRSLGGVDVGFIDGIPIPAVTVGDTFSVDVRINVGTNVVTVFETFVSYSSDILAVTDVSVVLPGVYTVGTDSPPGEVAVVGIGRQAVPNNGILKIATISFRAIGSGTATVHPSAPLLISSDSTSLASSEPAPPTFVLVRGRGRRHAEEKERQRRQLSQESYPEDFNRDERVDTKDAFDLWVNILDLPANATDPNRDSTTDVADVGYLLRIRSGLIPILKSYVVNPVDNGTFCELTFSVSLRSGANSEVVADRLTHVFVTISHPAISRDISVSTFRSGSLVTTIQETTYIMEAQYVGDGLYQVSIYTPILATNIELESIILVTTAEDGSTDLNRYFTLTNVGDIRNAVYTTFTSGELTLENVLLKVDTLTYFDNSFRSDVCEYVAIPINSSVLEEQGLQQVTTISLGDPAFPQLPSITFSVNDPLFFLSGAGDTRILYALRLDRETSQSRTVLVSAVVDGRGVGPKTVNVIVSDINDNAPQFVNPPRYIENITEAAPLGDIIWEGLDAIDIDEGVNSEFYFSIASGNSGNVWGIDPENGSIFVQNSLNFEVEESYDLVVRVQDRGRPSLSTSTTITINIVDANEVPPEFISDVFYGYIKEGDYTSSGQSARVNVTLEAFDNDTGPAGELAYSLRNGTDTFMVNENGEIVPIALIDREKISQYLLIAVVTDMSTSPRSGTAQVVVYVIDVNDNDPEFVDFEIEIYVERDLPVGSTVTSVMAVDGDLGSNGNVTYSIETVGVPFAIDPLGGNVVIANSLVDTTTTSYNLTLLAEDQGSPKRSSSAVLIVRVVESRFVRFSTDNGGFLLAEPTRTGKLTYIQPVGYPFESSFGQSLEVAGQVHVNDVSLATDPSPRPSVEISTGGDSVFSITATPLHDMLYYDWRSLTVVLRGYDNRGIPVTKPTLLTATLQPSSQLDSSQPLTTTSCTSDSVSGVCIARFDNLPSTWFERSSSTSGDVVNVYPGNSTSGSGVQFPWKPVPSSNQSMGVARSTSKGPLARCTEGVTTTLICTWTGVWQLALMSSLKQHWDLTEIWW